MRWIDALIVGLFIALTLGLGQFNGIPAGLSAAFLLGYCCCLAIRAVFGARPAGHRA